MKYFFACCATAILLNTGMQPALADTPAKIQASYDVIGFGMTLANTKEVFTRTDDSYQISSITKPVGLLAKLKPDTMRVNSHGKITAQGLEPLDYSLTRENETSKNASARFNWEKAVVTHTDYKGINDLELSKGAQDRLSVLYQLPLLAKTGKTDFIFGITDGNNLENYIFSLDLKEQAVQTPLGNFKARYFSNTPVGEQVKYEVWVATEHEYLPCKIIVTDAKGGKLTQVLTEISVTP